MKQAIEQLETEVRRLNERIGDLEGSNEQLRADYKQLVEQLDERFEDVSIRNIEASELDGLGSVLDDRFAGRIDGNQRSIRKLKKQVEELENESNETRETVNEVIDAL